MLESLLPDELVLVRHGHSEQNALLALRRAYQSDPQKALVIADTLAARPPSKFRLTELGCSQVQTASTWIKDHFNFPTDPALYTSANPFDLYFTSTFTRAQETAARLDLPGAEWMRSPLLCERLEEPLSRGAHESDTDFAARLAITEKWRNQDAFHWAPDAGESLVAVADRALGFLLQIKSLGQNRVFAVAHGGIMRVMRLLLSGASPEEFIRLERTRAPSAQVYNCEVWHFLRRLPPELQEAVDTGLIDGAHLNQNQVWLQRSRPIEGEYGEWEPLIPMTSSSSELLKVVEQTEPLKLPNWPAPPSSYERS